MSFLLNLLRLLKMAPIRSAQIFHKKGVKIFSSRPKVEFFGEFSLESASEGIGFGYFVDGNDVCCDSHGHLVFDRSLVHGIESIFHDAV
jgi:hypothetical protein